MFSDYNGIKFEIHRSRSKKSASVFKLNNTFSNIPRVNRKKSQSKLEKKLNWMIITTK